MSEQLPAPGFDAQNYARTQPETGSAAMPVTATRAAPDQMPKAAAARTAECKPILELKPGETKGRWKCTRTGGACESGPLPLEAAAARLRNVHRCRRCAGGVDG